MSFESPIIPQIEPSWQKSLTEMIRSPAELFRILQLDSRYLEIAEAVTSLFPLRVTQEFVSRMERGNLKDPLLCQVLPVGLEKKQQKGYTSDPLAENKYNPVSGILHKYKNRVLLTLTGACAINCRFCFRRHFPYEENNPGRKGWEKTLEYLREHEEIDEVIFSGGDPLMLGDKLLKELAEKLAEIPHLKYLRIHSRLPVVLPQRINSEFINWFSNTRLQPVMIIHCNHPQEIDANVAAHIQLLLNAKITVLNQTVLLKGVNDTARVLIDLSQKLFSIGILPYYLHLLDKVEGAAHFEVGGNKTKEILDAMRSCLPGYLMPRVVREVAGEISKVMIT